MVSSESSEIIRMFISAFEKISVNELDFYPGKLRTEIDELNAMIYENVNNGVYKNRLCHLAKVVYRILYEII